MVSSVSWIGLGLRQLVRWFVRIYYPSVEITNSERIPASGPVLLVANHANSMIDPVIIGIAARRPVQFFAKAPLFDIPIFGAVMHAVGMLPAYRGSDDAKQIKRNLETLSPGAQFLVRGSAVGIFPEGKSHDSLKLAMIRSGPARIALQAVKDGVRELQIVALGLNYERKDRFRSAVWVNVGEPIHVARVLAEHGDAERQALRALTNEIERRVKEVAIHLDEEKWESLLSHLEAVLPGPADALQAPTGPLRQRKRLADAMNYFLTNDPAGAEAVADSLLEHSRRLAQAGLELSSPILRSTGWHLGVEMTRTAMLLLLGLFPALLGTLHHLVPFLIVRGVAAKLQYPGRTTISQTRLLLGLPLYAAWYFLVWWWIRDKLSPELAWSWTLVMPFAGVFALGYARYVREAGRTWWREIQMLLQRDELESVRREQQVLSERLEQLAQEYRRNHP